MSAGHQIEDAVEGAPFHVIDRNKRSRFQISDVTKLMLIVTRRKSFAAPHGKGDKEWQAVADELNDALTTSFSLRACRDKVAALIKKHKQDTAASRRASGVTEKHTELSDLVEAYWQLKSQFEEKKQAASDEAKRKQKRLATAGGKAMRKAALRLKRRKIADATDGAWHTPPSSSEDEEEKHDEGRGGAVRREQAACYDREAYREMVGSDYSSEDEHGGLVDEEHYETDDRTCANEDTEEEEEEEEPPVTRKRLRVSEIWAKEEELMEKERRAQSARDRNLTRVVEGLANQTKMLLDFLVTSNAPPPSNQ